VIQKNFKKIKDLFLHHILHVEDTPHRIALGAASGIFVAWTPTFGFQTIFGIALAAILRANKAVVIPMAWVTNPLTNPPIYGFSYLVGHFLLTGNWSVDPKIKTQLLDLMKETTRLDIWNASFWSRLADVTIKIGLELWVGSCVVGLAVALITYPLIYKAVIRYRKYKIRKEHEHRGMKGNLSTEGTEPNEDDAPKPLQFKGLE
jgi:uncharacterized protein